MNLGHYKQMELTSIVRSETSVVSTLHQVVAPSHMLKCSLLIWPFQQKSFHGHDGTLLQVSSLMCFVTFSAICRAWQWLPLYILLSYWKSMESAMDGSHVTALCIIVLMVCDSYLPHGGALAAICMLYQFANLGTRPVCETVWCQRWETLWNECQNNLYLKAPSMTQRLR